MNDTRRRFKRESPDQRQSALIKATLDLISDGGPGAATVRTIAEKAGVTQGLIRHYFKSKEELVSTAYEHHMTEMTNATSAVLDGEFATARARLAAFIVSSLTPPVVDARSVALWAGFLNSVQRDTNMRLVHERTYYHFRDQLEALIVGALQEAGRPDDNSQARKYAIACNALIDGLWLEGGALPEAFKAGDLSDIGLVSVGAILGLNLAQT
jgi:TetR/AcrR family transcriptional regulator, transcriptional repressor of bet genes